jgi:hypothetical protein
MNVNDATDSVPVDYGNSTAAAKALREHAENVDAAGKTMDAAGDVGVVAGLFGGPWMHEIGAAAGFKLGGALVRNHGAQPTQQAGDGVDLLVGQHQAAEEQHADALRGGLGERG